MNITIKQNSYLNRTFQTVQLTDETGTVLAHISESQKSRVFQVYGDLHSCPGFEYEGHNILSDELDPRLPFVKFINHILINNPSDYSFYTDKISHSDFIDELPRGSLLTRGMFEPKLEGSQAEVQFVSKK